MESKEEIENDEVLILDDDLLDVYTKSRMEKDMAVPASEDVIEDKELEDMLKQNNDS